MALRSAVKRCVSDAVGAWRRVAATPAQSRLFSVKPSSAAHDDDDDDKNAHLAEIDADTDTEPFVKATISDVLKEKQLRNRGLFLWCTKDDMVLTAIKKMVDANVGSLLVFNEAPKDGKCGESIEAIGGLAGIMTERDYMRKVAVKGRKSDSTPVSDIMTSKLITIKPDTQVLDALAIMTDKRIRHIPVVDKDHLYGTVSINDVVRVVVRESKAQVGNAIAFINGTQ